MSVPRDIREHQTPGNLPARDHQDEALRTASIARIAWIFEKVDRAAERHVAILYEDGGHGLHNNETCGSWKWTGCSGTDLDFLTPTCR